MNVYRHVSRPGSLALTAAIALYGAGCASAATRARRQELLEVAKLGLAEVESSGQRVVVVAGPHVPKEVVATLGQLRTVIPPQQVPPSERFVILPGYFVLQQVSIRGAHASFVGTAGPQFKNHSLSCGSTFDINLARGADGVWRVAGRSLSVC